MEFTCHFWILFLGLLKLCQSTPNAYDDCDVGAYDYYQYESCMEEKMRANEVCRSKCNQAWFEDENCAQECHIEKLPSKSLQDILGSDKINLCCPNHDYAFLQRSECGPVETMCGNLDQTVPQLQPSPQPCPIHCTRKLSTV